MVTVQEFRTNRFQKTVRPWTGTQRRNRELIPVAGISSAATGALSGHRAQGCCGGEIDAGDLDDGLPRGFLAGAIVEVWVALRLNWA